MNKKFLSVCESALTRFSRGGFLVGDVLKFVKAFEKHEEYKQLGSNVHDLIGEMLKTGLHVRVVGINDAAPARYPGNPDTMTGSVVLNIALDNGGGRYTHYCTVPSCIVEPENFYPNLPPMPDSVVRPDGTTLKPIEFKYNDTEASNQTLKSMQGDKLKDTNNTLPDKNVKFSTASYMQ